LITFPAKVAKAKADQKDAVALLVKRLKGWEKERSHKQVHVSDITKETEFCARQFAIYDALHTQPKDVWVSAPQRVAYDQGKSLHDMCRNEWLADDVVGHWQCLACKHIVKFSKKPYRPCACGVKLWRYKECEFIYPEAGITGSIDFLLDFGLMKHSVYEAKSMDKDKFAKLIGPVAEHQIRTQCYLYAIDRSTSPYKNRIDLTEGRILYISKAYGTKSVEHKAIAPFREFVVPRDDKAVAEYFEPAIALRKYRDGTGPMPKGVCPNPQCKRAQFCNVIDQCFSGKF
jgi:hypothetical protein